MATSVYSHFRISKDDSEYKLKKTLGSGGFGITYLGTKNDKDYVIKQIQITKDNTKSLLNEVEILKRIKKNKCVSQLLCYHDSFINVDKGTLNIVTKSFKNAITLREYIDNLIINEVFLPYEDIIKIFSNLLNGLQHLHKIGIAHGDVKPENILIEQKYLNIQYIDFGLSCYDNCLPTGTLIYASPEILKQIPANIRTSTKTVPIKMMMEADIFSLGIVFFLLANLQMPVPLRTTRDTDIFSEQEKIAEELQPGIFIDNNLPLLGLINFYTNRSSNIISFYNYNSTKLDQKLNTLIESMLDLKPKPKLKILIKQLKTINILYNFMSSKKILSPRRKISIKTENPVENKDYFVNKNAEAKYLNIESELDKVLNLGKI
jgi:serine/threonine protein kinase